MMTLKSLIQDQKLRIDSHTRGEDIPRDLIGVHIHKSFYNGKRSGKSVRISIKGESIHFDKDFNDEQRRSIVNEIRRTLEKDRQKLLEFSNYIVDALKRWSQKSIQIEDAKKYASGIAERFGLKAEASKTLIKKVEEQLVQYQSIHKDMADKVYTINQNSKRIIIRPGSSI